MNITSFAHKFFIFGGLLLMAIAAIQILSRRRQRGADRTVPRLDASVVRAVLFLTVGVLAVLAGAGVIPMGPGR
jgi:hypothetical protein